MKKTVVPLLLLISIGALWWLLDRGDRNLGGDGVALLPAPEGARQSSAVAPREPGQLDKTEAAEQAPPPQAERDAVAVAPAWRETPHAEGGLLLRIVHAETGAPVPGAEVRFLDDSTDDVEGLLRELGTGAQYLDVLERFGARFVSDGDGEVRVPFFERGAEVMARRGGLFGLRPIGWGEFEPVVIEVGPAVHLRARVLDSSGNPRAGVPVALRQYLWEWGTDLITRESDRDGLVEVRHVGALLANSASSSRSCLALVGPLAEPVEVPLDPDDLPRDPVDLILPAVGEVEVRLVGAEGELVRGELFEVALSQAPPSLRELPPVGEIVRAIEGGRAVFPAIGLGLQLEVTATRRAGGTTFRGSASGPGRDGERVVLPLTIEGADPRFTGRLLDPDGRPLARCSVGYTLGDPYVEDATLPGGRLRTDADGCFEFLLAAEKIFGERPVNRIELRHERGGGGRVLSAVVALGADPDPVLNDLGDVRTELPPRLVAGHVLDLSGAPVPQALVTLNTGVTFNGPGSQPRSTFQPTRDGWAVRSAADGSFEFFAGPDNPLRSAQLLILDCEGRYHSLPEPIEVAVGAANVVLTLHDKGRLAGSLLLPKGASTDRIGAARTTRDPERWELVRPDSRGSFAWDALTPGLYDVKIALDDQPEPVLVVPGVEVRAGETTEDPRLQRIDLRERIRGIDLHVVDGRGEPIVPVEIVALSSTGERHWRRRSETGSLQYLCTEPVDLTVTSPGYRVAHCRGVVGDRTVTLEPGPPIQLVLTPRFQLPEGYTFRAVLLPRDNPSVSIHAGVPGIAFDPEGEAGGHLSYAGAWTVVLHLHREAGPASSSQRLRCTPTGIEVPEQGGTYGLSLDAEEVQAAID